MFPISCKALGHPKCARRESVSCAAAQVLVVAALSTAGASAAAVQYVAVHGTGTPLGDPIEVGALGAALGTGRSGASQLLLGSSKVCRHASWQMHIPYSGRECGKRTGGCGEGALTAHLHVNRPDISLYPLRGSVAASICSCHIPLLLTVFT